MQLSLYKKAKWIAEQMNENMDDLEDVLRGNITGPSRFVSEVESYASEYDYEMAQHMGKLRKHYDKN